MCPVSGGFHSKDAVAAVTGLLLSTLEKRKNQLMPVSVFGRATDGPWRPFSASQHGVGKQASGLSMGVQMVPRNCLGACWSLTPAVTFNG